MASQIEPILVKDDILMATDKLSYAVLKGGQNVSVQSFPATSTSANSHVYQINVPSTSVVLDRHLLWRSEIIFTVTGTPVSGRRLVDWGLNCAVAPFPLHQLVQNMSAQINNTTVSATTNQILDPILRCLSKRELARYNSTTAVYLDNYGDYNTLDNLTGALNNPMGGYDRATDPDYLPRGATHVEVVSGNGVDGTSAVIKVRVAEPLMLSPFLYGETEHKSAGFYGINNINFNMSMDSAAKRALRFCPGTTVTSVTASYTEGESNIECRFLTPHPSDLLPETNIVPYQEFTNYIRVHGELTNGSSAIITSNNIQLSSIPDKVFVWVRPRQGDLTYTSPDSYATITGVSVLFDNQSGLISSASAYELYNMSTEAGSQQNWIEWSGKSTVNLSGVPTTYSTCGGPLVLNFAEHIGINQDYYSCGSIGNFNFQVTATVKNNLGYTIQAELSVMFMQGGVFVTSNGVSSKYLGILSKEQVLQASLQEPIGKADLARLVGGGFFSRLWQGAKNVAGVVKKGLDVVGKPIRQGLEMIPHPIAQGVAKGLKAVGYGQSGGRMAKHIM
jgi:hypothetical protein